MKICEAMLTRNEIKLINSLSRKKERQLQGLFIVEGNKSIEEVLKSGYQVSKIFGIDDHFSEQTEFSKISAKELDRISQYKTSSEALALVKLPEKPTPNYTAPSILLEDINDPGNLGTIIRTADWFGVRQIICSSSSVDCFNPKVVSATKGSLFRTNIIYMNLAEFIAESSLDAVATSLHGDPLNEVVNLKQKHIVFGNESHGISKEMEGLCQTSARIPSFNSAAESLNLAISVGIFLGFTHLNCK